MDFLLLLKFAVALAFVLGLIGLSALAVRRFGPGGLVRWRPGPERRLGVVEVLPLDPRRRLVLVRRDGVEHLLLLGAGEDRVVETGIVRSGFRNALAEAAQPPGAGGVPGGPSPAGKEPT
jgi:flagellar protein FliO/FliZ